jgi:pSer/pThr/pTyr-binding forkhead associated (FHA) protein
MSVKLKVIHGALKKNDRFQVVIPITKTPFAIGRAPECDMRCHSEAISRRHCEIRVAGFDVTIVDLDSRNGVHVNGQIIQQECRLTTGDRLAIGRLEFELIIELPKPRPGHDPLGDSVCELLLEADRSEAGVGSADSRWYKIEPCAAPVDPYEGMSHKEKLQAKARRKIPQQSAPRKLPKRVAESADAAIRQALAKYSDGVERCYRRPQRQPTATDTIRLTVEDTQGE